LLGFQKRQNLRTSDILLLAAWAGMALISQRNIPLFSLAAGPALAILLNAWLADWQFLRFYTGLEERLARMGRRLTGWFWSGAAILILGVASLATASSGSTGVQPGFDPAVFPVKAVDWLIENPQPGKMFNYFPWGGYLLYRLWPDQTVFIDGQTDFYGETLTREYEQIITLGDGWDELLRAYQVDWIIIPSEGELSKELSVNPDWQTPYHDQFTTIFTRQSKTTR
jgi:hypothetical protein